MSWAQEVIQQAGPELPAGVQLKLRGASEPEGGDHFHANEPQGFHDAGLHLDFELVATNGPETPFFAVVEHDGKRYVSGNQPDSLVVFDGATYSVAPDNPANRSSAVQVQIDGSEDSPLSAWDNYSVLLGIRPFLKDNHDLAQPYDMESVRAMIKSLLFTKTDTAGPSVAEIYFNDPRTWGTIGEQKTVDWNGDGVNSDVKFSAGQNDLDGLNGVIHVSLTPPVQDSSIDSAFHVPLIDGLEGLAIAAQEAIATGPLSQPLALTGSRLSDAIDMAALLNDGVKAKLEAYFVSDSTPTTDEFVTELAGLYYTSAGFNVVPVANTTYGGLYRTAESDELRFSTRFRATKSHSESLDLGAQFRADGLRLLDDVPVNLQTELIFDFQFGMSLNAQLQDAFFVRVNDWTVTTSSDASNRNFDVALGILEAFVANAAWNLNLKVDVEFNDPEPDARTTITRGDLLNSDIYTLAEFQPQSGSMNAILPVSATFGSFDSSGQNTEIQLSTNDVFSPAGPYVAFYNFEQLSLFTHLDSQDLQSLLGNVEDAFDHILSNVSVEDEVPFTTDSPANDFIDLDTTIGDGVLAPIGNVKTLQDIVQNFRGYYGPSNTSYVLVEDYNPFTLEATLAFDVSRLTGNAVDTVDFPLILDLLIGLESNSTLSIQARDDVSFTLVLDLAEAALGSADYGLLRNLELSTVIEADVTNLATQDGRLGPCR